MGAKQLHKWEGNWISIGNNKHLNDTTWINPDNFFKFIPWLVKWKLERHIWDTAGQDSE